jgi:hypothetical protein
MQGSDTQWLPVTIQGSAGMGCTAKIYRAPGNPWAAGAGIFANA